MLQELRFGPGLSSTSPLNSKRRLQNHIANHVLMTATRKGDTIELLLLLPLLSLISRTLREIGIKEHCDGRNRRKVKKHYYEN